MCTCGSTFRLVEFNVKSIEDPICMSYNNVLSMSRKLVQPDTFFRPPKKPGYLIKNYQ